MSDKITLVNELRNMVEIFVSERAWQQFHTPKNLAMSIAIEAAELMELFQWSNGRELGEKQFDRAREELADVIIYCLAMANALKFDLTQSVKEKLIADALKYPVERCRGKLE